MKNRKFWQIFTLSLAAIAVIAGGVLFVGAASGWFDNSEPVKVTLSSEYQNSAAPTMLTVDTDEFNALIDEQKSFLGITYLPGCTANILTYLKDYATARQLNYIYYPWSLLRDTWLHDSIKYTPSVFIISNGKLVAFLAADSDADTEKYNSSEAFAAWLDQYLK